MEQVPFGNTPFAENPEPRCPCLLLLDTSGSMMGEKIAQLNAGLQEFEQQLKADSITAKRVEVAILAFGPVNVHQDFITANSFVAPALDNSGDTPMGAAIRAGIDLVD